MQACHVTWMQAFGCEPGDLLSGSAVSVIQHEPVASDEWLKKGTECFRSVQKSLDCMRKLLLMLLPKTLQNENGKVRNT